MFNFTASVIVLKYMFNYWLMEYMVLISYRVQTLDSTVFQLAKYVGN